MFKIILLCTSLVLVSSLTIHYFSYRAAENSIEYSMGQMALNIIGSVNSTIDSEKFEALVKSQDSNDPYYTQLKDELFKVKKSTGLLFLYTISEGNNGEYIYIVDGEEAGSEDESLLGDVEDETTDKMLSAFEGIEAFELNSNDWGELISGYVPIQNKSGEIIGIVGADFDASYVVTKLDDANRTIFMVAGMAVVISVILSIFVAYLIIRSLKNLQLKINVIKEGDLTVKVGNKRTDEVGHLSEAFQSMIDSMSSMIHGVRRNTDQVFTKVDSLNNDIDITNKTTEEITKIVTEIAHGANLQVNSIEDVDTSMNNVFTEIKSITNHIEDVLGTSDEGMKNMQEASVQLENTVDQINVVNDTVDATATVMKNLEVKFQEVLSFSDIVTSISKQTNLLALNASIEAASAGQHGKGFAVVAEEIKNLAKKSSDASKKINDLIISVQEEIDQSSMAIQSGAAEARNSVSVMAQVKLYLDKLSSSNESMNGRIKDIMTAILRIEENSKHILSKTTTLTMTAKELNAGTQQASAETEEQYAIMEGIRNDLQSVRVLMEELTGSVNQFKV